MRRKTLVNNLSKQYNLSKEKVTLKEHFESKNNELRDLKESLDQEIADRQEAINPGLRELIVNVQDEYEVYKPKNPYVKIELKTNNLLKELYGEDIKSDKPLSLADIFNYNTKNVFKEEKKKIGF